MNDDETPHEGEEPNPESRPEPSPEPRSEASGASEALGDALDASEGVIQSHVVAALAAGLVPVPVVDLAAIMVVQMNMLRGIAELYDQPFSDSLGRSLLASLAGGLLPLSSASLLKSVPVIGALLGGLSAPVLAGASTYAVGRVFVMHFESGGTFLTFDPDQVRDHYERELERGETIIRDQRREQRP